MKRSEINEAIRSAKAAFEAAGWALPPSPRWDVTDFGLGSFREMGLVLVNLAEEAEYCEKIMFATRNQKTIAHTHAVKKEDIIVRRGVLMIRLWNGKPEESADREVSIRVNGEERTTSSGSVVELRSGERVTLRPGVYHEFWPASETCVIGEVSTANDDANDNIFVNPEVGRFPAILEDESPLVRLVGEPPV
jgi:D-lyxose ketol-isomerase